MRRTGKAIGTLAAATSLALVGGGLALADVADNDVSNGSPGSRSVDRGGETDVKYWVDQTKDTGEGGSGACNISSTNKTTVTITMPSVVSASAGTVTAAGEGASKTLQLEFSACGTSAVNSQTVTFSAPSDAAYAAHNITHAVSGGSPAVTLHSSINFSLKFEDITRPVVSVPADVTQTTTSTHKTVQFTVTATDNNAVTQINCTSASSVALTGSALTTTAGATSRTFSGSFPIGEDTLTCTAKDGANNNSTSQTFKVTVGSVSSDTAAPVVTFDKTGAYLPNGDNGWFKRGSSDVTTAKVKVVAEDPAGVDSITCRDAVGEAITFSDSGSNTAGTSKWGEIRRTADGTTAISCSARDVLGNATADSSAATHSLKLDNTLPAVTCPTGAASVVLLNAANASISATVADATGGSGIPNGAASKQSGTIDTAALHRGFTAITIADAAGNVGVGDNNPSTTDSGCAYAVQPKVTSQNAAIDGTGLTKAKAGSTVPLKFRLLDANNVAVLLPSGTTASPSVHNLSCADLGVTPDADAGAAAGNSGLQNLGDGYYQYNWKTPSTYANSCKTFTLSIADAGGLQQSANFQFVK